MSNFMTSWGSHMLFAALATFPVTFSSAWYAPFAMSLLWWLPFGYCREAWQDRWELPVWDFDWHKHREALAWPWGGLATSILSLAWAFL